MQTRYLYKYVAGDEIIYIGMTDHAENVLQHKRKIQEDCKVFLGICPNRISQRAYKDLLIDYYRPKYNAESNSKEPKFDGQPLWEPNWILLEDYLKENSTMDSGKDIIMPTLSQIKEAESRYNIYLSDYERIMKDELWDALRQAVSSKKDYVHRVDEMGHLPYPFSMHEFKDGELIPCEMIVDWMVIKKNEVASRYKDYVEYSEARGIKTKESIHEKYCAVLDDLEKEPEECSKQLKKYMDKICYSERLLQEETIRKYQEAHDLFLRKANEFMASRQPLYLIVSYGDKERYKRLGCKWSPDQKKWYATEKTWYFKKDPMTFLRRMAPEEVEAAIEAGLLNEEDLIKDARVAYRVWLKESKGHK